MDAPALLCTFVLFLNYCCLIWGNTAQNHLNRINILQRRALKTILKGDLRTSSEVIHSKTKVFKAKEYFEINSLIFTYKHLNSLLPSAFDGLFTLRVSQSQGHSPSLWSSLPEHILQFCHSINFQNPS